MAADAGYSTDEMNARLLAAADVRAGSEDVSRAILHAYVACLRFNDLVEAAATFLAGPAALRGALRNRLVRLSRGPASPDQLAFLATRLLALKPPDRLSRTTLDTLLSALYPTFPPEERRAALDRWLDIGTASAAARWLKAMSDDELMFDAQAILSYWRNSRDWRAAKVLAYKAAPELLSEIMPELVRETDQGWIASRAAIRLGRLETAEWEHLRSALPASYLYLCAMLGRQVDDDEAVLLVRQAGGEIENQRGLAIWALGEMGMVVAVDAVRELAETLLQDDRDRLREQLSADGLILVDANGDELGGIEEKARGHGE